MYKRLSAVCNLVLNPKTGTHQTCFKPKPPTSTLHGGAHFGSGLGAAGVGGGTREAQGLLQRVAFVAVAEARLPQRARKGSFGLALGGRRCGVWRCRRARPRSSRASRRARARGAGSRPPLSLLARGAGSRPPLSLLALGGGTASACLRGGPRRRRTRLAPAPAPAPSALVLRVGLRFSVYDLRFRVSGLGFRV